MNSELLLEISERIELVSSVEILVVLAVRTLDFAVVSRCKRTNELVFDLTLSVLPLFSLPYLF